MQEIKYPDLNIQSQETLSQQLFENNNQNIKFIPVIIPNQNQFPQITQAQPIFQNNQIAPYQEYSNYQITQQQQTKSNLIKDQDFLQQKKFLKKILGIFILWTIIACLLYFFFCLYLLEISRIGIEFYIILIISIISIPILIKVGLDQNHRNKQHSIAILIGLIISHTLFYQGIFGIIMKITNDGWASVAIFLIFLIITGINFFANFIMMIYISIENNQIRSSYVCFAQLIFICLFVIILKELSYFLVFAIPYPFCVMNVLKQILKGRFNLQDDQIFTASIAAFYGMFICCQDCD
ncbi:unnamed protein product [Paramecium sonneborni]|uniref:Transmembrane protein n=1 Tax=Paramecium sonneborni TaxID=65129 RepID=A0A8S1R5D8_9CILI|nr:unnamed protein product [Paramecium sonneborni]